MSFVLLDGRSDSDRYVVRVPDSEGWDAVVGRPVMTVGRPVMVRRSLTLAVLCAIVVVGGRDVHQVGVISATLITEGRGDATS